jgi:hypothetical protein
VLTTLTLTPPADGRILIHKLVPQIDRRESFDAQSALFTTFLVSALILPLTAQADTLDDFTLAGDGHTITYSLPATSAFPDFPFFNSFTESAPTTIDGVSGYVEPSQ